MFYLFEKFHQICFISFIVMAEAQFNPIALRKAKLYTILVFLSALGLRHGLTLDSIVALTLGVVT